MIEGVRGEGQTAGQVMGGGGAGGMRKRRFGKANEVGLAAGISSRAQKGPP